MINQLKSLSLSLRSRGARSAALVRASAGISVGVQQGRRGSILVVVLGTLALLSVVTLIYVTLGQADRRAGAVVVQRSGVEETAKQVGAYLADVIARDALAVSPDPASRADSPLFIREAFDFPSTDFFRESSPPNNVPLHRFDPAGDDRIPWNSGSDTVDPRQPSDPWLASSAPVLLDRDKVESATWQMEARDWWQISNFAPDGRFVNLYNLRNNFDARPGNQPASNPFGPEMSRGLWLYDDTGKAPASQTPGNSNLPWGGSADPNIPAHWTMYQQFSVRPMNDPTHGPGDWRHLAYSWADADGDGIADSRWFELVDATDLDAPIAVLPRDGQYRWFIAARAEDLSGRVNINTGTDYRVQPSKDLPTGIYPSDVDVRRVLLGFDTIDDDQAGSGYKEIAQPKIVLGGADDYSNVEPEVAYRAGAGAFNAMRLSWARGDVPSKNYNTLNESDPLLVPMTAQVRMEHYLFAGAHLSGAGLIGTGTPHFKASSLSDSSDLAELLTFKGINNPDSYSRLEQVMGGRSTTASEKNVSPIRENRGFDVERDAMDLVPGPAGDGRLDPSAMALLGSDIRQLITPLSWSRPIRSTIVTPADFDRLTVNELRIDAVGALQEAARKTNADPSLLFQGFADALLPYSAYAYDKTPNVWSDPANNPYITLNYGDDPRLALRIAAHMTANAVDSYDKDDGPDGSDGNYNRPSAYTLLLEKSATAQNLVTSQPDVYGPWQTKAGRLDLSNNFDANNHRLPDNNEQVKVMNIYGVEAQPFLSEVATIHLYRDTPLNSGGSMNGDDDAGEEPTPGNPNPPNVEITIKTQPSALNPDFMIQIVAFQVTNPFDDKIRLSSSDPNVASGAQITDDITDYYIEFGDYRFQLADSDPAANDRKQVILDGGETRTFYALCDDIASIRQRWINSGIAPNSARVEEFIKNQLQLSRTGFGGGEPTAADPILMPNPTAITGEPPPGFRDLLSSTQSSRLKSVKLKRVYRTGSELGGGGNNSGNDILVDRMTDDLTLGSTTLDSRLDVGAPPYQMDIDGTTGYPEGTGGSNNDNTATGFTIATVGRLKRYDLPVGVTSLKPGVLPPWCVETARWGATFKNNRDSRPQNLKQLKEGDFTAGFGPVQKTGKTEYSDFMTTYMPIVPLLPDAPSGVLLSSLRREPKDKKSDPITNNIGATPYMDVVPQLYFNNDEYEASIAGVGTVSKLRVADLLATLAIGPEHIPSGAPATNYEDWMTLGEAAAVSMNYGSPPVADVRFGIYNEFGQLNAEKLDRGTLRLDQFVPYVDINSDGNFNPVDYRAGMAWPLALNILANFQTLDPQFGGLTRGTPGLININTAPLNVLRAIPMLSPTTAQLGSQVDWWGNGGGGGGGTIPEPGTSDIAATLFGYRYKLDMLNRDGRVVNFRNTPTSISPNDWQQLNGRTLTSEIIAQREAPGLASVGEIMLANNAAGNPRLQGGDDGDSIDFLGRDNSSSGAEGLTTQYYKNATGQMLMDAASDDVTEKMLIANAAMGSVTVRSDLFAVWFVLHGYQRTDCDGLSDAKGDPLVPSIARRYLMVVDRSNIVRRGDKPKLVLFTEVPMR